MHYNYITKVCSCGNECDVRPQPHVKKRKQQIDCNREAQQGNRKSETLAGYHDPSPM